LIKVAPFDAIDELIDLGRISGGNVIVVFHRRRSRRSYARQKRTPRPEHKYFLFSRGLTAGTPRAEHQVISEPNPRDNTQSDQNDNNVLHILMGAIPVFNRSRFSATCPKDLDSQAPQGRWLASFLGKLVAAELRYAVLRSLPTWSYEGCPTSCGALSSFSNA
jgi:hypothetical protein